MRTIQRPAADDGSAQPGSPSPRRRWKLWPPQARWAPAALWRDHRLFAVVTLVSVLPRIVAALGFKPVPLIQDSFSYLQEGTHFNLGQVRPAGYPVLLRVLEPFHSLLLVTTLQHAMGIGIAIVVYAVLRRCGLPAWGATLAAVPTLFDSRQIWLESSILPDTLFTFVLMIAAAILIVRPRPGIVDAVTVGGLVAWASVIRGNGAPVFVIIVAFLLIRRAGWRVVTSCLLAFALPLLAYMAAFDHEHGEFDITDSTGMFLWSRTMSFANCDVIHPPASLVALCPQNQPDHPAGPAPAWSVPALLNERTPADYLWAPGAWYHTDAHHGINGYNNSLAMDFALRAIAAQPLDYLKTVGEGVMLTFIATDRSESYLSLHFTTAPYVTSLTPSMTRDLKLYAHAAQNTHVHQPWAFLMFVYQLPVWFPGIAFFAVVAAGLVLLIMRRRGSGGYAALAWAVAAVNLVVPVAAHELDYRYAISAVPFACLALALSFRRTPDPGR